MSLNIPKNKGQGLWIPHEILLNKELNAQEKIILGQVVNLQKHKGCFAGNTHFGEILNLSSDRAGKIISNLVKKGFLFRKIEQEKGNLRWLYISEKLNQLPIVKNNNSIVENNQTLSTNTTIGIVKNNSYIKELNNNNKYYKNEKQKKSKNYFQNEADYSTGLHH